MPNYKEMRRSYHAARADARKRGGGRNEFLADLRTSLREGHMRPDEFRLAPLFEEFVEDGRAIRESFNPRYGGHGEALLEGPDAVTTTDFANITGQLLYSKVLDAYNSPTLIGGDLVSTMPTQFDGEKIPGIGAIGDMAEQIGEGQHYPLAGLSEEWVETPSTIKRGMIVPITKEAIFFDRTGLVLNRAAEVGQYVAINKEKRILDVVLGVTTTYKRNGAAAEATYGDSGSFGDNLAASNALVDYTDVENALLLFDALTSPSTGEPIIVNPDTIIVPSALLMTLGNILRATRVQRGDTTSATVPVTDSPSPLGSFNVRSNAYVKARSGSASTWWIGDFKGAFVYAENWPITVSQAPPDSHDNFHRDIVTQFKVSERGAAGCVEPRKVVKCTA